MLAPRATPRLKLADRVQGRGWALVPIASIVGVVFLIRYASDSATGFTWLALVAVPPLAAAALGWAMCGQPAVVGARGGPAVSRRVAGPRLVGRSDGGRAALGAELRDPGRAPGHGHPLELAEGRDRAHGCGRHLAGALRRAASAECGRWSPREPPGHLPQLQSESFGTANMGYGDLFVAALLGAVLARDRRLQLVGALAHAAAGGPVRPAVLLPERAAGHGTGGGGADRARAVGVRGRAVRGRARAPARAAAQP